LDVQVRFKRTPRPEENLQDRSFFWSAIHLTHVHVYTHPTRHFCLTLLLKKTLSSSYCHKPNSSALLNQVTTGVRYQLLDSDHNPTGSTWFRPSQNGCRFHFHVCLSSREQVPLSGACLLLFVSPPTSYSSPPPGWTVPMMCSLALASHCMLTWFTKGLHLCPKIDHKKRPKFKYRHDSI